jgi:hypothetical protein
MKRALIFAITLLTAATAAQAQNGGWRVLGFKTVGVGSDTDIIRVNSNRVYRRLQLCAFNAPIDMQDFDVFYGNGGKEGLKVRNRIAPGTCTRSIDLKGGKRHITQIRLRYGKIDRSMRVPLVRVMGRN